MPTAASTSPPATRTTTASSWADSPTGSSSRRQQQRARLPAEGERLRVGSMWQSLSYGANYKAAYCMAVCPAGEEVIGPFKAEQKAYLNEVVRPLQEKKETVYVVKGSDAESHVARRFPNKTTKRVGSGLRPTSVRGFPTGCHCCFNGELPRIARYLSLHLHGRRSSGSHSRHSGFQPPCPEGHQGISDLRVIADGKTWLVFCERQASPFALLRRKIRLKGSPRLLLAFGRCFPM